MGMEDGDNQQPQQNQIKGVVIITLPPPDNPSLGKTITAFALSNSDDFHYTRSTTTTTATTTTTTTYHNLPTQQQQNQQTQFSLPPRFTLGTPRKLLGYAFLSLFALLFLYNNSSFFSNLIREILQGSSDNDGDDENGRRQSFLLPLYNKFGYFDPRLKRFVYKESLVAVESVGDGVVGSVGISKLASASDVSVDSKSSSSLLPVRGNVYPDGLYYTYIFVGNPPHPYHLDIDTGGDITWIQCDAPCTSCARGANALYKPTRANLVPSQDSLCEEVQRNQMSKTCETCQQCDYEIEYADHSSSLGVLAKDKLHLTAANGSLTKLNFIFGCGYDQQGVLLNTLEKTDGLLGLSRAKVSLPSQLANQGIINNVVGHCLATDVRSGGYLFLGDDYVPGWGMTWVPMLDIPSMDYYQTEISQLYYGSSSISLGGQDKRVKRVVFDSGSSYTYFTKGAYSELVASLKQVNPFGFLQDTSDPALPFCWRPKSPIRSVGDVKSFFKTLTLQFSSKWRIISTKFRIPPEGYLIINNKGNVCLGILDGSNVHDGSSMVLGDISLRGQLVVYDNTNKKIGWMPSDCVEPKQSSNLPFFEG